VVKPGADVEAERRTKQRAESIAQREALFIEEDVAGDGDCLFRAIANLRFGDEDYLQEAMRVATAQFAALHWEEYQVTVVSRYPNGDPLDIVDRQDFVERFSEPQRIWSTMGEVQAMANMLGIRIRVWFWDGQVQVFWPHMMHPHAVEEDFPEYNIHFTGDHFRSLFPRDALPPHLRVPLHEDFLSPHVGHSWHRALAVVGVAWCAASIGVGNVWFGHDMSTWPPSNIRRDASGVAPTLSWLYMPVILAALRVRCPSFTFHRTERFETFKWAYRAEFRRTGITWASLQESGAVDGDFHLTAAMQEQLIWMLPEAAYELAQYRTELEGSQHVT
jgi:hypothetical protein